MLRKNTSGQNLGFKLVNASTGAALTGATVTVYRSIDGGAQAAATGTVSEKGNGQYSLALSSADVNGNQISFLFVATGAVLEEKTIATTTADPTDSQRFGLAALPTSGVLAIKPAVTLAPADVGGNLPADVQTIKTQAVTAASGVTFPASIGTSTYSGGDTAGVTTLLSRVSANVALAGTAPSWWTAPDNTTLGYLNALLTGDHTKFTTTALANAPSGGGGGPSAATIAAAVWDELKSAHSIVGSFGTLLDVSVSGRATNVGVWDLAQSSIGLGATMGQLVASYGDYVDPWVAEAVTVLSPTPTTTTFRIDKTTLKGTIAAGCLCVVGSDALRGVTARVGGYDSGTGDVTLASALPVAPPGGLSVAVQFQVDPVVKSNLQMIKDQAVTAAAGVAFPASIASQTVTPGWWSATPGDGWSARAVILGSPTPTATTFRVDNMSVDGAIVVPAQCVVDVASLRGAVVRVASHDAGTGDVVLADALPAIPAAGDAVLFRAARPAVIDLAQPLVDVKTTTVGGALNAAWATGWGKVLIDVVGKLLKVWGAGNVSPSPTATFTLDNAASPTSRTPD